jgi:hypothetical protein
MAFEDASNCGHRRHQAISSLLQRLVNGWRSTLTQHTGLQLLAHAQHAPLLAQRGAIPRPMRSARTIFEVTAVQTLAFAALDPKRHIARAHTKAPRNPTHGLAVSYRLNHLPANIGLGPFLRMLTSPIKKASTIPTCSTVAEH